MARTKNGKLTGRAAASELADQRIEFREQADARRAAFSQEWHKWLDALVMLDEGWEKWYDERPEQTTGEMLPLIKERVLALSKMQSYRKHPDTTLREIANNLGVTAVHCDGWDLQDDTELAAAVRAVHGEAPEPEWMTEARAQMADAKDLQETQENARL